jgi:hypothetical protein
MVKKPLDTSGHSHPCPMAFHKYEKIIGVADKPVPPLLNLFIEIIQDDIG